MEIEEQQGVEVEAPTTEVSQEVVTEQAEDNQQPQVEVAEDANISTVPPVGEQQVVQELDDMGVPYKNRYMEAQRKLEKTQKQQEEILQKLDTIGSGQKQPEYSIEELEQFVVETDNDAHKVWAQKEIRKKQQESMANIVRSELDSRDKARIAEQTKQQALTQVMQRYPDAFSKNTAGQTIGWNNGSPLTQRIAQYMTNPEIANNPQGLLVAAALAHSDISVGSKAMTAKQTQTLKNEVRNLQKQTLVESGNNKQVTGPTKKQIALEKSKSGAVKDSVEIMKEMWKAAGRIE